METSQPWHTALSFLRVSPDKLGDVEGVVCAAGARVDPEDELVEAGEDEGGGRGRAGGVQEAILAHQGGLQDLQGIAALIFREYTCLGIERCAEHSRLRSTRCGYDNILPAVRTSQKQISQLNEA